MGTLGIWEQRGRGDVPLWSPSIGWISVGTGEGPSTEYSFLEFPTGCGLGMSVCLGASALSHSFATF